MGAHCMPGRRTINTRMDTRTDTQTEGARVPRCRGTPEPRILLRSSRGRKRPLYNRRAWVKIWFLPTPTVSRFPQLVSELKLKLGPPCALYCRSPRIPSSKCRLRKPQRPATTPRLRSTPRSSPARRRPSSPTSVYSCVLWSPAPFVPHRIAGIERPCCPALAPASRSAPLCVL